MAGPKKRRNIKEEIRKYFLLKIKKAIRSSAYGRMAFFCNSGGLSFSGTSLSLIQNSLIEAQLKFNAGIYLCK